MKPGARIQSVIEIIEEIFVSDIPADKIISFYLKERRYIGSKDRRFIQEKVWNIVRSLAKLEWWQAEAEFFPEDAESMARGLVIAELCISKDEVKDFFDGEKYSPEILTEKEKAFISFLADKQLASEEMPENIKLECPQWLYAKLYESFGEDLEKELDALNGEAVTDIRVNTLKTDRSSLKKQLTKQDISCMESDISPLGLRLEKGRYNFNSIKEFKDGLFEVQDEGSQLIALLANPEPETDVLDICAGAGGKTLALACLMKNKGKITACDISQRRLEEAKKRIKKTGIKNTSFKVLSDENPITEKFDTVLVDAPCSGSGTWRRAPDARWQLIPEKLFEYLDAQEEVLEKTAGLVKEKGRLIYATCSVFTDENQKQVANFEEKHPDFKPVAIKDIWENFTEKPCPSDNNMLQLTPFRNSTDGFFIAVWQKD